MRFPITNFFKKVVALAATFFILLSFCSVAFASDNTFYGSFYYSSALYKDRALEYDSTDSDGFELWMPTLTNNNSYFYNANYYIHIPRQTLYSFNVSIDLKSYGSIGGSSFFSSSKINVFCWDNSGNQFSLVSSAWNIIGNTFVYNFSGSSYQNIEKIQFSFVGNGEVLTYSNILALNGIKIRFNSFSVNGTEGKISSQLDEIINSDLSETIKPLPAVGTPNLPAVETLTPAQESELSNNLFIVATTSLYDVFTSNSWFQLYLTIALLACVLPLVVKWLKRDGGGGG